MAERNVLRLFRDFCDGFAKGTRDAGIRLPETEAAFQAGLALCRWNQQQDQESEKARAQKDILRALDEAGWEKIEDEYTDEEPYEGTVGVCDRDVIRLPGLESPYVLSAAPVDDGERTDFWRYIFENSIASVIYAEVYDASAVHFLPWTTGAKGRYGDLRVQCKSTASTTPHGFEAQLIVRKNAKKGERIKPINVCFRQARSWPVGVVRDPDAYSLVFNHPIALAKLLSSERKAILVCETGLGNSCVLLLMYAAMTNIEQGNPLTVRRLLRALRRNRPGAVQSSEQYLIIIQILIYSIKSQAQPNSATYRTCCSLLEELQEHVYEMSEKEDFDHETEEGEESDDSMESGEESGEGSEEGGEMEESREDHSGEEEGDESDEESMEDSSGEESEDEDESETDV